MPSTSVPLTPHRCERPGNRGCGRVAVYVQPPENDYACRDAPIDPVQAAQAKIQVNARKYPVALAKGSSKKYDQL